MSEASQIADRLEKLTEKLLDYVSGCSAVTTMVENAG